MWPLVIRIAIAAAAAAAGATSCSGCHPPTASAETKVAPLRGQNPAEIVAAMQAFRSGERPSTVMGRIAKGFSDDETRAIAAWVAPAFKTDHDRATRRAFLSGAATALSRYAKAVPGSSEDAHRRPWRWFRRRDLRAGAAPRRSAVRGHARRAEPDLHGVSVQQRGHCRSARHCGAALRLRRDPHRGHRRCARPGNGRRPEGAARYACAAARRSITTGW